MEFIKPGNQSSVSRVAPNKGALVIRAYCAKCGKLLQQSVPMSKKQLRLNWDKAVIGAVGIKCDDCGLKFPNFDINLRICNMRFGREYLPTEYIKLPKGHKETPDELFRSISRKWLKDHPEQKETTPEEVAQAMNESREELLEGQEKKLPEQLLKEELEKRSKYYGEGCK